MREIGYDVIAMVKKTPKMFFRYNEEVFRTLLADNLDIADDEITALVDAFMDAIPTLLKTKLQAA